MKTRTITLLNWQRPHKRIFVDFRLNTDDRWIGVYRDVMGFEAAWNGIRYCICPFFCCVLCIQIESQKTKEQQREERGETDFLLYANPVQQETSQEAIQEFVEHKLFCFSECRFLVPTESQQSILGDGSHFCKRYNASVRHNGFHPQILRLQQCNVTEEESKRGGHGID
jgi:hypothetical protein